MYGYFADELMKIAMSTAVSLGTPLVSGAAGGMLAEHALSDRIKGKGPWAYHKKMIVRGTGGALGGVVGGLPLAMRMPGPFRRAHLISTGMLGAGAGGLVGQGRDIYKAFARRQ